MVLQLYVCFRWCTATGCPAVDGYTVTAIGSWDLNERQRGVASRTARNCDNDNALFGSGTCTGFCFAASGYIYIIPGNPGCPAYELNACEYRQGGQTLDYK